MADTAAETAALIAEAKGRASVEPVKVAEMRAVLDRLASMEQGFAERQVDFWNCGVPSPDFMRRIVVLEATIRFLGLCEDNGDAIKKILAGKR